MTAPTHPEELLDAWRAGELGPDDDARLRAHARACVACRLELGVGPGLEAETALRPEDETKMAAMIGAAMVELPEAASGASTPSEAPPAKAGAGKLLLAGAGLAAGIAAALVLAGRGEPGRPQTPSPAPAVAPTEARGIEPDEAKPPPRPSAVPDPDPAPETQAVLEAETEREATPTPSIPDAAALLREANVERRAHRYPQAARIYDRLARHHRGTDEEILARVTYAKMLLDHLDRPADALRRFDAYLATRPQGTLAEEALTGRAKALGRLGRGSEEREAWRTLLSRFPDSVYADLARRRGGED